MNILVPDSWLREYLETNATTEQIKEYLSLCGPSIEHVSSVDGETVYNVEITTNRADSMSVAGVAREAAAILPRFGIDAKFLNDPYEVKLSAESYQLKAEKKLNAVTDPKLISRWMSVVISNVTVGPSPKWLSKRLELTGIRTINNVVDITNYLMRAFGQPAHVFDYDRIGAKNGVPTMILRASKTGEKLVTLDGKTHTLPGDDIVIEDGTGALIDLCGIMGGKDSSIHENSKTVVLFLQTYDPVHIRRTSMALAHRTDAATLFEKGLDSELVGPAFAKGIELFETLTSGKIAGEILDIYPEPFNTYLVDTSRIKLDSYIGNSLLDEEIIQTLSSLGFKPEVTSDSVRVAVPSFRRDITIDVDIIEEVARLHGYHTIKTTLPDGEPPIRITDPQLNWEKEIKVRLRDWGYTETYSYSMISEELMDIFALDKTKAYKIANPLSNEWVYMRPQLTPSVLLSLSQNIHIKNDLKFFELSTTYQYRPNDLPIEKQALVVVWTGDRFYDAKGLAEVLFDLMGIIFPSENEKNAKSLTMYNDMYLNLDDYGSIGGINTHIASTMGIDKPVTRLYLDISTMVKHANTTKRYTPIPKYPPSFEDIALTVQPMTRIGDVISALKSLDPLISDVTLLDSFENTRTLHVTYLSTEKNLTSEDVKPVREKILAKALANFGAKLKV